MAVTGNTEPVWDIARLWPDQGAWTEEDYFALPGNRLVEYSAGQVEVLAMPTEAHQLIVLLLYRLLVLFSAPQQLGTVVVAPLRVQLWPGKFREPDIVFMRRENTERRGNRFWRGADLVMEVVSPDDPRRDTEVKPLEYARAGITEYWLVNPLDESVTVFSLLDNQQTYQVAGRYQRDETAQSVLLKGFTVDVGALFDEPKG